MLWIKKQRNNLYKSNLFIFQGWLLSVLNTHTAYAVLITSYTLFGTFESIASQSISRSRKAVNILHISKPIYLRVKLISQQVDI